MAQQLKMNALREALHANSTSYGEAIPSSLLQDVFAEWTRGRLSDEELVAALLPLKGQPPLLRLQILAQAVNLGQLLSARAESCLAQEEEATHNHLEALEDFAHAEGLTPAVEATQAAFALHLQALHTLSDAVESNDPDIYLKCLELGDHAAYKLKEAQLLADQEEQAEEEQDED